jgi:Ca2+-binding RTX toxin-like protein
VKLRVREIPASGFNFNYLDGGNGNDNFILNSSADENFIFGGDGNDSAFIISGEQNNVSGGAGNDWLGVGGGRPITCTVATAETDGRNWKL